MASTEEDEAHGLFETKNSGCWDSFLLYCRGQSSGSTMWTRISDTLRPPVWKRKTLAREWAALRSEWRFLSAAFCYVGPPLNILWAIKWPLLFMAAEILLKHLLPGSFNTTIGDDSSVYRIAFGICSFALSLLLASRVNNVVIRFNEARAAFEKLGNVCVVMMQVLATSCDDEEILQDAARWCVVYHNSVRKYLEGNLKLDEDDTDTDIDLNSFLHEDEVDMMRNTHKMRQMALLKIRQIVLTGAPDLLPSGAVSVINSQLETAQAAAGDCVRIYSHSLPYGFTSLTTGFILIWLLVLPLGFENESTNLQTALPAAILTGLLLLGLDAAAIKMENPFPYIPMGDLCASTMRDVYRALDEGKLLVESAARNKGRGRPAGAVAAANGPKGRFIAKKLKKKKLFPKMCA